MLKVDKLIMKSSNLKVTISYNYTVSTKQFTICPRFIHDPHQSGPKHAQENINIANL